MSISSAIHCALVVCFFFIFLALVIGACFGSAGSFGTVTKTVSTVLKRRPHFLQRRLRLVVLLTWNLLSFISVGPEHFIHLNFFVLC